MTTTYRIAEVAERSGFTPAALRYYEDIGLLRPAGRTDAGYRLYDDGSLQRLRFIARAKQLGCSLDEIAELSRAWDGGRCAHVQERLRATVDTKVAESQRQIAELTALTADLQRAAAGLAESPTGACDDTCGCLSDRGPEEEPSIACTLDVTQMGARVQEWEHLLKGVVARSAIDGGVRLRFGPGTDVTELARLAAAEQDCCRFFRFDLSIDTQGVALEVRAPGEATDVVSALFA